MGPSHRSRKRERGYVLFALGAMIIGILGFAGFVVDMGIFELQKRKLQSAADAAAFAAALDSVSGGNAVTSANEALQLHGIRNGVNGVQVAVNKPPASGPNIGNSKYTEVIVSRQVPTVFLGVLNRSAMKVAGRSVAGPNSPDACVWILNTSASAALSVTGSSTVNLSCGVLVNSSSADAVKVGTGACLSVQYIGMSGQADNRGSCAFPEETTTSSMPHFSDPLASLAAPSFGSCTAVKFQSNSDRTIDPGVYCGGIRVNGGTLTLNPGIYILAGGGLEISSGSTVLGNGVMFYNTAISGYNFAPLKITGTPVLRLSAPTSGVYAGILFFQNRNITSPGTNRLLGSSDSVLEGTIYIPKGDLQFSGNANSRYTSLVVDKLEFTGNSSAKIDYSLFGGQSPLSSTRILE